MKRNISVVIIVVGLFFASNSIQGFNNQIQLENTEAYGKTTTNVQYLNIQINFSIPEIVPVPGFNYSVVRVNPTNHNRIILFNYDPDKPVLPANISVFTLPFGTKILSVDYQHSDPESIPCCANILSNEPSQKNKDILSSAYPILTNDKNEEPYPLDWLSYHTGGGLWYGERTTFLVTRVYPARFLQSENQIEYIQNINVTIVIEEPAEPLIQPQYKRDLLILSPQRFIRHLQPLVDFKDLKTEIYSLEDVYQMMSGSLNGRDKQEQIKYFIKEAIEKWDITYVLLVGGLKGQTNRWHLPVRYSGVVPPVEQEYAESSFISDLYYADIFDSEGKFSSWDSNFDDVFSVWNETFKEEMDLYPDVYFGRLPCRSIYEVRTMVRKIINYEKQSSDPSWFNNILLVAGDSYINDGQWPEDVIINEGEIICEATLDLMPGCTGLKVYASADDINRKTVNKAFNQGAGFAFFCGHGSPMTWSTHFEPANETNWVTGYILRDMMFLRNKEKQPVTVVGGCHNGEFDVSLWNIITGIREAGLGYFSWRSGVIGQFWYNKWSPRCWAWMLTIRPNGGSIATIANTGLGTHGDGDQDYNGVVDYLEVLDGWLELRFFELYGMENSRSLGLNHGQTLTEYLHKFLGDESKMDVKMVQQWQLFGDPSLQIGGYQ
ncbi:MAG: C25 family cysteine peptidase [Thermoplasmatota archaeon]